MGFSIYPLTPERWSDLEDLFNRPGASIARGCWCMCYRRSGKPDIPTGMTPSQFNKRALKALVDAGVVPGLIGYQDGVPMGWVSLGPREDYRKLTRSPVMKPIDDKPVWSIICFFVDARVRGQGIADKLLKGAISYARTCGATLLEAYPVDKCERSVSDFMWHGAKSMYDHAGFIEAARRKPTRPIVRKAVRSSTAKNKS